MTVKLNAATGGGSVSLSAPNSTTSNADVTLTLPQNDGDASQFLQTNGSGTLTWASPTTPAVYTSGTTQSLNTETSVIVTGIPSNAVRVFIALQDVSWAATAQLRFRLGTSSAIVASNYSSTGNSIYTSGTLKSSHTTGFQLGGATSASHSFHGHIEISLVDTNDYVLTSNLHNTNSTYTSWVGGRVQLGGVLERFEIEVTASSFDSGQFRVDYLTQS